MLDVKGRILKVGSHLVTIIRNFREAEIWTPKDEQQSQSY